MNWNNVNLNEQYECDQNILDSISFNKLLLEVHCNLPVITEETVRRQFETDLKSAIDSAREVFEANIKNIVKQARKERAQK